MTRSTRFGQQSLSSLAVPLAFSLAGLISAMPLSRALSQEMGPTGSIAGRVTDELGVPLVGVQVLIQEAGIGSQTRANGDYLLLRVPVGTHMLRARTIGYRSQSASVTVSTGQRATQDFTVPKDPLNLAEVVVTGSVTPRTNLEASVALT